MLSSYSLGFQYSAQDLELDAVHDGYTNIFGSKKTEQEVVWGVFPEYIDSYLKHEFATRLRKELKMTPLKSRRRRERLGDA